MKGLWLEEQQLRLRTDLPLPETAADEARVRVLQAGVCNTDLELVRGYYPYTGVPGHEFVGVVEHGPEEWQGRRVVGDINAACGQCPTCASGDPHHCPQRTVLGIVARHGAFAEHLSLPVANLHRVPDSVPDDSACFAEPLAAALEIQEQLRIDAGQRVLVVGDGKLGNLVAQTLALTGCDLLVVGRHADKLRLLEQRGIRTAIATADDDGIEARTYDIAVECTGNPEGFQGALRGTRPRGTLVLKSTYAGNLQVDAADIVVNEITVLGSRCGPMHRALQLLGDDQVDVASLIAARFDLDDVVDAFAAAQTPGTLKVLVRCS